MPATQAQLAANRANARKSTAPNTPEGQLASRANALKHGLTSTLVLPEREAAEVRRRSEAFYDELLPTGEVGMVLVRLAATLSVRMERCSDQENAALTERARRAEADFVAPQGADEATSARLRAEAGRLAQFDPSAEATLARRYEAAAIRGFFRALQELRRHEAAMKRADAEAQAEEAGALLASFRPGAMTDEEFDRLDLESLAEAPPVPPMRDDLAEMLAQRGRVDVPLTIGKRR